MKYSALIVEDDSTMVRLLQVYLEKREIKVHAARDGEEAMRYLSHEVPDIIISDILMPQMDGLALRNRLLQDKKFRMIPFIFVTAKNGLEDRIEGYKLYVDDYIVKPFEPRELIARVDAVLKRHALYTDLMRFDGLTSTLNRKTIEELLEKEFARVSRYGGRLSVSMVDIDHFKRCNDTHGHVFGDYVLIKVADAIQAEVRNTDAVGRYGGEEFLIVMPETKIDNALTVVDRIRKGIARLRFDPEEFKVRISAGVAQFHPGITTARDFVHLADQALYRAKGNGRNRVECFREEEPSVLG